MMYKFEVKTYSGERLRADFSLKDMREKLNMSEGQEEQFARAVMSNAAAWAKQRLDWSTLQRRV